MSEAKEPTDRMNILETLIYMTKYWKENIINEVGIYYSINNTGDWLMPWNCKPERVSSYNILQINSRWEAKHNKETHQKTRRCKQRNKAWRAWTLMT